MYIKSMAPLKKGVAYHGNRILKHVEEDMKDIIEHGFNLVVHMFSHNDWDRHKNVMKEIIKVSESLGLEVWVDNWGLGGPPGDKSHFLSYHPHCHQVYSNGEMDPVRVCLNSPEFRKFTKDWIDVVYEAGGRKIFWDEPHLAGKNIENGKPKIWTCSCSRCKSVFAEKYGKEMPMELTPEIEQFRIWTVVDYFREVTEYSKNKAMENIVCVMLGDEYGINLDTIEEIGKLCTLDNIGSDPYWYSQKNVNPYEFVYKATVRNLNISNKFYKDHNIWIQGYAVPKGREEEIILATDAAYDAGARTILVWGYRGAESNDYKAENPDLTWKVIGDAMHRITERERDTQRNLCRASIGEKE
jgi:hypothetical protein